MQTDVQARNDADMEAANQAFYEPLWTRAELITADKFNTWPLVQDLLRDAGPRMEVAPGLRPRFPLAETRFLDLSEVAVTRLQAAGADATQGSITEIPYPDDAFATVCAFDVVEHVDDDEQALAELARVLKPGGRLLVSTPLYMDQWTEFDRIVGHRRRYEPDALVAMLARHGFVIERSAAFGMRPKANIWSSLGMWFLQHYHAFAMRWYNRVLKYTLHWHKPLQLSEGLIPVDEVNDVLLVCRFSP